MTVPMSLTTVIMGGYNCDRCGAWVGESQTHSCAVYTVPSAPPAIPTREDIDTIIRLLQEIEYHVRTKR